MAASLWLALLVGCGADGAAPVAADDPEWGQPAPSPDASAEPEVLRHASGVMLTVPIGWRVDIADGEARLVPPEGSLLARLTVLDTPDLDAALAAIDQQLDRRLAAHDIGSDRAAEVNGLPARLASGSGRLGDEPVKLRIALVATPRGQVFGLVALVRPAASAARRAELSDLVKTIRPAMSKRP